MGQQTMKRPRIAISMGDPAGVGPELVAACCADPELREQAELSVYGSSLIFARVCEKLQLPLPERIIDCCDELTPDLEALTPGEVNAVSGAAAIASLRQACDRCLDGSEAALVTAPINKEAARLSGFQHPGHTEFLAAHCGSALANGAGPAAGGDGDARTKPNCCSGNHSYLPADGAIRTQKG